MSPGFIICSWSLGWTELWTNGSDCSEPGTAARRAMVPRLPNLTSDLLTPYPSPDGTLPLSTPGTGVGRPWFIHPVLSSFQHPFLIPLATKLDPSRSRAWQLSWERLIARKEGGAWREEEGKACKPALRLGVGSGPSQRTHRGWGSSALQYGGAGQQGAALPLYPSQVSSLEPQTCFSHTRFVLMTHLR